MKHIKKLASLLLVLVMVFALATTAFAEEPAILFSRLIPEQLSELLRSVLTWF